MSLGQLVEENARLTEELAQLRAQLAALEGWVRTTDIKSAVILANEVGKKLAALRQEHP